MKTEIYDEIIKAIPQEEIDNHESDLYVKVSDKSTPIIKRYVETKQISSKVTVFRSQTDNELWYEIPFAYLPWWRDRINKNPKGD